MGVAVRLTSAARAIAPIGRAAEGLALGKIGEATMASDARALRPERRDQAMTGGRDDEAGREIPAIDTPQGALRQMNTVGAQGEG